MPVRPAALAGGVLLLAAALLLWRNANPEGAEISSASVTVAKTERRETHASSTDNAFTVTPEGQASHPDLSARALSAAPSETARRRVQGVTNRGGASSPLTADQVAEWRRNLDAIIREGDDSVAAIAEFLATKENTIFEADESEVLGFSNTREALLDALARIGGAQAIAVMADVLANTTTPAEVAMLARNLDALAPAAYRQQAVSSARESLAVAMREPAAGVDVAPLFEVLLQFGGVEATAELERAASHWGHYATLALAAMPEGGGVPSLLRIADAPAGRAPHPARLQALQVIAQLASSDGRARASLLRMAREDGIPAPLWPYLARPLAGEQARLQNPLLDSGVAPSEDSHAGIVHITNGNQNLIWTKVEGGLTAQQQTELTTLLRELAAVTKDPDGRRILQQTQVRIEQESGRISGIPKSD